MMAEKIKILLIKKGDMSLTDLAKLLNTSIQNLSNKMKRDDFSEKELVKIAEVLNCEFKGSFIMKDSKEEV